MTDTASPLTPPDGLLADWVRLYAPMGESPDEMHLAAAISLLSAAVGWRCHIRWGEAREPVTLNVILTGKSATARKTTTAGIARTIADMAVKDLGALADNPPLRVRDMGHTSDRGLLDLVVPKDREQAALWESSPPPGHLLVWDEIGGILGRPGDVKGQDLQGRIRTTLMQFTGGRHGGIQLSGDQKAPPGRCAVSILGTMTRTELEQRLTHGVINDGFMGRMILIPYGGRARYLAEPPRWTGLDTDAREHLVRSIRRIITSEDIGEAFGHFTPHAHDLRRDWYVTKTRQLDHAADDGDEIAVAVQAAHGRLQAAAVKLAVLSAVSRAPADQHPTQLAIDERDVEWGIGFADLTLQEIQSLAVTATESVGERYADKVTRYLHGRNGGTTKKQVLDGIRFAGLSRPQRWAVVEQLHTEGTVEIQRVKTGGKERLTVALPGNADRNTGADTNADTEKNAA